MKYNILKKQNICKSSFITISAIILFSVLLSLCSAQSSPGPYEILPLDEGYIIEAWFDLLAGTLRADWSGWTGSVWESPHTYNGHTGTDFSLQSNTPVYAAAKGKVVSVVTNIPANTGSGYGNYVRIQVEGKSPLGLDMDVITAHMMPSIQVSAGQNVTTGQLIGYSDNTGNSTSEHQHFESLSRTGTYYCPFYHAMFKYPIMFNPKANVQIGHVIKIIKDNTPVKTERWENSTTITNAFKDQLYFSSYWHRGYYYVFIPNTISYRSGWIKAIDAEEVFTGTVIQALPDSGDYVHTKTLASPYDIKFSPDNASASLGKIYFGGGRFVADQISNGYYRIPITGSASWGWVKPDNNMVVYPQLYNPNINLSLRPDNDFPIKENFTELGRSLFGRPKFNRGVVKSFSPTPPNGDGKAIFLTDATNYGDGVCDSVSLGKVNHRNYYVQVDTYFSYEPSQSGYERYGVFLRDDGFAGLDQTFEGKGNCYAILYDSDDGRLRATKITDSTLTDFLPAARYITSSGWHTLKIEAKEDIIKYYLDGSLLIEVTDSTFPSGLCGFGFSNKTTANPADRGAYFDNFIADTLDEKTNTNMLIIY